MAPSDREIDPRRHSGMDGASSAGGRHRSADEVGEGIGPSFGPAGERMDPMEGFRSVIRGHEAMAQTVRQITQELQLAADAAKQFQVSSRAAMTDAAQAMTDAATAQQKLVAAIGQRLGALPGGGASRGSPSGGYGPGGPGGGPGGTGPGGGSPAPGGGGPGPGGTGPGGPGGPGGGRRGTPLYRRNTRTGLRRALAQQVGNRFGVGAATGAPTGLQTAVSGIADGFAAGGAMGAVRAVPYVGTALAAMEVGNDAMNWVGNQQKKNSFYQSIYGGSKVGTGLSNRMDEESFVLGNRFNAFGGGLDSQDARTAFQGVSQLGFQGARRSDSLSFVESNYAQLGTDVGTSLQLLQTNASHAQTSLSSLTTALSSVSTMAQATGQNANVLYQAFAQNFSLAQSMGGGSGSAAIAAGITGSTIGQSRDFAGIDSSRLNSTSMHYRLAQASGMPYSQLVAQSDMGNTKPMTQAQDKINTQWANSILGNMGTPAQQALQQAIASKGGAQRVLQNTGALQDVADAVLNTGVNIDQMKANYASASGEDVTNLDPRQVMERLINRQLNPTSATDAAQAATQKFNQSQLSASDNATGSEQRGFLDVTKVTGSPWVRDRVSTDPGVLAFGWGERGAKNDALKAYTMYQQKTNNRDPVIENLIDSVGKDSNAGVQVQTGNGSRVVSLSDAITYYTDQVAKGNASIVGGSYDGKSVQTLVGGAETNYQGADTSGDTTQRGQSLDDWKKNHPDDQSSAQNAQAAGTVTISMTPQMSQFFQVQTTGAAKYDAAAQGAVPPALSGGLPQ